MEALLESYEQEDYYRRNRRRPETQNEVHQTTDSVVVEGVSTMTRPTEISTDETTTTDAHKGVEVQRVDGLEAGKEGRREVPSENQCRDDQE